MRNLISALSMLVISLGAISQTATRPATSSAAEEVRAAVTRCLAAGQKGDSSALTQMIADDFVGTTFSGTLVSKDDVVPADGTASFPSATIQDMEVRVLGDTAVAIGAFVFEQKEMGRLRFTEVWNKRPGGWQLVVAHLSRA